jgi:hypothetical protein
MSSKQVIFRTIMLAALTVAVRKVCSWRSEPDICRAWKGVKWEGGEGGKDHSNIHSYIIFDSQHWSRQQQQNDVLITS